MNQFDLDGRVAVVTGGAQGIGRAVVERMLAASADIAIWEIDRERLDRSVGELRAACPERRIEGVEVDIADAAAVAAAAERTLAKFGRIDILINNAALVGPNAPLVDYPPAMIRQNYGRIVNIASIAGKEGNPSASAYSSAKAAVIAMTKSLGKELAKHDIAVNCVTPAVARTPGAMEQAPAHIDYMLSRIPRGRFLELSEAASMIVWLSTAENSFTTGAVFDLSGGRATY
jgi:3-oxoacyl-[acyl-carrier protein] reductase